MSSATAAATATVQHCHSACTTTGTTAVTALSVHSALISYTSWGVTVHAMNYSKSNFDRAGPQRDHGFL